MPAVQMTCPDPGPDTEVRRQGELPRSAALALDFPTRDLPLGGRTIYVIRDLGVLDLDPVAAGFDVAVSGHSHRPRIETERGVVYPNPGGAGPRRFRFPIPMATIDLKAGVICPEIHELVDH